MRRGKGAWRLSELHQQDLKNVRARAAMHGVAPRANMNRVAPEPFIVKGIRDALRCGRQGKAPVGKDAC